MPLRRWTVGPIPQPVLVVREVEARMKKGFPAANGQSPQKGNQITAGQMDGCHWGGVPMRLVRVAALILSSNQELVSLPALNSLELSFEFQHVVQWN